MLTVSNRRFILSALVFFVVILGASLVYLQHFEGETSKKGRFLT